MLTEAIHFVKYRGCVHVVPSIGNSSELLTQVERAVEAGSLSATARDNIRAWLVEPCYADYRPLLVEQIAAANWRALDDAFWNVIPFGTGGRRGMMYPIGSATINDRTIGESAQGLADYVRSLSTRPAELSCAIAYDTRHRSREFAELCAEIMVASGFKVWFLDGYRSTPELSFAVRRQHCACGIMITASHNPPADNAIKVYWSTGGQLLPPHDRGVIERVMSVKSIQRLPLADALRQGRVMFCQEEVDRAFIDAVCEQGFGGPRQLKVVYTPMHGVGASSIGAALAQAGFADVELFAPQAQPDGDFPNVPGHVSNPESLVTYEAPIARAEECGADLVLSSDPDADRLGCAARMKVRGAWQPLTGNQIGALLTDYVLESRQRMGRLGKDSYVVKTLVTTEMVRRIADSYGVRTVGDLQVGFKYIGGAIDDEGPAGFALGVEESHGYLAGTYARDKDAAVSALLLAELAAQLKASGQTVHEKLDALYWQHGYHLESQFSQTLRGAGGMARMQTIMAALRSSPPAKLAGLSVIQARDYKTGEVRRLGQPTVPLVGSRGDMVMLDLAAEGNYLAVRPSGTEPKIKFYLFTFEPAEQLSDLEPARSKLADRLAALQRELSDWTESV